LLPFGNSRVDNFFVCGESDSTSRLDLLSILVESITYDRLGAILVCGDGLGREGIVGGIIELLIISPVRATATASEQFSQHEGGESGGRAYFATLDIFVDGLVGFAG
jgi:hypothetical protein